MATYMTRESRLSELSAMGVTGHALEALLRETAPERHRSRVAYARHCAEEWYLQASGLERDEVSPDVLRAGAALVCWLDVLGIGGTDGVSGDGTTRHPAFTGCGKGRKHASDGGAWDAAILEAAGSDGRFAVNDLGCVVWEYDGWIAAGGGEMSVEPYAPPGWMMTLLREGLRRAAGLRPWHQTVPVYAQAETLPRWAAAVNEASTRQEAA